MKASLQISAGTQAVVYSCSATNRAGTGDKKSVIITVTRRGEVIVIPEKEITAGFSSLLFLMLHLCLSKIRQWGLSIMMGNINIQLQTFAKGW